MKYTTKSLLEQYVLGKDKDQYQILETIFTDTAEVEFQINSDQISFPEKIKGNKSIARILSKDFNKKYENIKTYYLKPVDQDIESVANQPWLVVMKEIGREVTRVGTGAYSWKFKKTESGLKISKLRIYIHEMLEVVDLESSILTDIQGEIVYPWPTSMSVGTVLGPYTKLQSVLDYINNHSR